ncbi:hypothetical protein FRC00_000421, partial [Tulasnella sp. 408]
VEKAGPVLRRVFGIRRSAPTERVAGVLSISRPIEERKIKKDETEEKQKLKVVENQPCDRRGHRWRGKYKYEIPVLHLNDKMQAKGRWGEPEILKALEWYDSLKPEEKKGESP